MKRSVYRYTCILSLIIALPGMLIAMNQTQTSSTEKPFLVIHDYQIRALIEDPAQQFTPFQNYQKLLDELQTTFFITDEYFKSMEAIALNIQKKLSELTAEPVALNYFTENFTSKLTKILELSKIQAPKDYGTKLAFNENLAQNQSPGTTEIVNVLIAKNGIIQFAPFFNTLGATLAKAINPGTLLDYIYAHHYKKTTPITPLLTNIFKPQWFVVISLDDTTNVQATIKIMVKPYADYQKPGTQTHDSQDDVEELDAIPLNDSNRQKPITSRKRSPLF